MNIIERLYDSYIDDTDTEDSQEYIELISELDEVMEKVVKDKKTQVELDIKFTQVLNFLQKEKFELGFQCGVKMMKEVYK